MTPVQVALIIEFHAFGRSEIPGVYRWSARAFVEADLSCERDVTSRNITKVRSQVAVGGTLKPEPITPTRRPTRGLRRAGPGFAPLRRRVERIGTASLSDDGREARRRLRRRRHRR